MQINITRLQVFHSFYFIHSLCRYQRYGFYSPCTLSERRKANVFVFVPKCSLEGDSYIELLKFAVFPLP